MQERRSWLLVAWVPTLTLHGVEGLPGGLVVVQQHDTVCDAVDYDDDDAPWRGNACAR